MTEPSSTARSHSRERTALVFGATGQQGGAVAAALLADGWSVRALVRDPASKAARRLAFRGVALHQGDYSDHDAIRAAITGVHGVYSMQPSSGSGGSGITDDQEIAAGKAIADLAVESGVRHFVYASAATAGKGRTGMGHLDSKIAIEDHVRGLDIAATIVRPATFMELLMLPGMGLDQGRYTFFLRPDQSAQFIAVQDIGRIVAGLLNDVDRFGGHTIEISGDELTGRELGAALTEAADRPIAYQRFPDSLLESDPFLGGVAALFDSGLVTGSADLEGLRKDFGELLSFRAWLATTGKPLLEAALAADSHKVALR